MSSHWQTSMGPNFVPAYQVSGIPFVTSSDGLTVGTTAQVVRFPQVTRFFVVTNTSEHPLRVGFTKNGVLATETPNYFVISGSAGNSPSSVRLEIRCKELWFLRDGGTNAGFSLVAGMSGVDASQFPILTGTLVSTSHLVSGAVDSHATFRGVG